METSAEPTHGRDRSIAQPDDEKQDEQHLRELEQRLVSVRATKQLLQSQLTQLNAEAAKLELLERKSRQQTNAQATKLTRMQQLQANATKRREEEEAHRGRQEAARQQREEEERARRERSVDVTAFVDGDSDFQTLEDFLAGDAAAI